MNWFALLNPIRRANRRAMASCCIALYAVACSGFSLPIPAGVIDYSVPFPCQNHNCGCNNAEQCWNNCCCMTMAQRLAWARENHIEPPSWVAASSQGEATEEKANCSSGCCHREKVSPEKGSPDSQPHADDLAECAAATSKLPAACDAGQSNDAGAICTLKAGSCCQSQAAKTPPKSACCQKSTESAKQRNKTGHGWLNVIEAQKCSGHALDWVVAGATIRPALPVSIEADTTCFWIEPAPTVDPGSPLFRPEVPPPRSALV